MLKGIKLCKQLLYKYSLYINTAHINIIHWPLSEHNPIPSLFSDIWPIIDIGNLNEKFSDFRRRLWASSRMLEI